MQTELYFRGLGPTPSKIPKGITEENDSPSGNAFITAFRPKSKIPTAPQNNVTPAEKIKRKHGLYASPLATPTSASREDALKNILSDLEARLDTEQRAKRAVEEQLHRSYRLDESAVKNLETEAACHGDSIIILSDRVEKVRSHLSERQDLHERYQESAKKVKNAANMLQVKEKEGVARAGSRRLSATSTAMLRQELDKATASMNNAVQRVEQIEIVTDSLIRQLADTEAELAAVQKRREEESSTYAEEVNRLMKERMQLQNDLEVAVQRASEVEAQEEDLMLELEAATLLAEELACEVVAADRAKTQAETRLASEKESLDATLADLRAREAQLTMQLTAKEGELAEAVEKAALGTPVGRGAKIVLPMALQRLKHTEQALRTEETLKATVEAQLAQVTVHGAAREAALKLQLEKLEAQKNYEVSEKQASFDSMKRTVALATTEAVKTQEAVLKLVAEVTALDTERTELRDELQDATHTCLELEAQLAQTQTELIHACAEREEACSAAEALQDQLTNAAASREELAAALEANREHALALELTINAMRVQMESNGAAAAEKADALRAAVANAEAHSANTKLHLAQAMNAQASLIQDNAEMELKLSEQNASVAELTSAVAAANAKVADLNSKLTSSADAAAAQRIEMMRAVDVMQTQIGEALQERDDLRNELSNKTMTVAALEDSVAALRAGLIAAEDKHAIRIQELENAAEATENRLAATMAQLAAATGAQDSLRSENSNLGDSIRGLQDCIASLNEEKAALNDALESAQQQHTDAVERLQAQLQAATAAQDSLLSTKSQLEESVRALENRVASMNEEKLVMEAAQNDKEVAVTQLRAQLQAAIVAQDSLLSTKSQLEESVHSLQTRLASMHEEKAVMEAAQYDKEVTVQQLQVQLQAAVEAQDSLRANKTELEMSVDNLKNRLSSMDEDKSSMETAQREQAIAVDQLRAQLQAAIVAQDSLLSTKSQLEESIIGLQSRMDSIIEDRSAMKAAHYDKEVAIEQLQAQLEASISAQDSLRTSNSQLEESVLEMQTRMAAMSEERSAMEALQQDKESAMEQLRAQLQGAVVAQTALIDQRVQLEQRLVLQEACVDEITMALGSLSADAAEKEEELNALAALATERAEALAAQLQRVCDERDGIERNRTELRSELDRMAEALQAKESELAALQEQSGASKQVLDLSFNKIRDLQKTVADTQSALDAKISALSERDTAIAELQEAARQREELAVALHRRMETITEAAQAQAADLSRQLQAEREAKEEVERVNAALAPQVEALVAQLEAAVAEKSEAEAFKISANARHEELSTKIQATVAERDALAAEKAATESCAAELRTQLEQLRAETTNELAAAVEEKDAAVAAAEGVAAELRAELAQLRSLTDDKENSNKEAIKRTIDNIHKLKADLAAKTAQAEELQSKLQCAEETAASLTAELATKSNALAAANTDNEALERAMCRLRVDVQVELEARQSAEKEHVAAQEEITRLENVISDLRAEAAVLRETVAERSQKLEQFEERLSRATVNGEDMRAARDSVMASLFSSQATLASTEAKVATLLATLEAVRAGSAKKEAAAEEAMARALEKIAALEIAVDEREGRAMELAAELDVAQSLLSEAAAEATLEAQAKETLLEKCRTKEDALAEMELSKEAATNKAVELEGALGAAQAQVETLRAAAAVKASTINDLQASSIGAKGMARIEELEALNIEATTEATKSKIQLTGTIAHVGTLRDEKSALAAELAAATAQSSELEEQLAERSSLVQRLSEALDLQKEIVTTVKRLGAAREAELARALCRVEERLAIVQQRSAAELQTARVQIAALRRANEALSQESAKEQILALAHFALAREAQRSRNLEEEVAELKKVSRQYDVLERANLELCAQIQQARAQRRVPRRSPTFASGPAAAAEIRSHQVEIPVHERDDKLSLPRPRSGKTLGALSACSLAMLWANNNATGSGADAASKE